MSRLHGPAPLAALALLAACAALPAGAPPPAVAPERPLRLAVIGDYGDGSPAEAQVAALVQAWGVDYVVTAGDNAYPDAQDDRLDRFVGGFYGAFAGARRGGAPAAERRFWPVAGNHDWRNSHETLQPYRDYFQLPGNGRYYDVPLGGGRVHLFALDSDTSEPDGIGPQSAQARWLKERLAASPACLKLVVLHHPPYSSSEHGSSKELRWPYRAFGADVVIAGHDHSYERLEVDGIPYFVDGVGGARTYAIREPLPESRFRWVDGHGALRITAGPAQVEYEFFTAEGARLDRLAVEKACPAPAR